jgi:hypothetical protein
MSADPVGNHWKKQRTPCRSSSMPNLFTKSCTKNYPLWILKTSMQWNLLLKNNFSMMASQHWWITAWCERSGSFWGHILEVAKQAHKKLRETPVRTVISPGERWTGCHVTINEACYHTKPLLFIIIISCCFHFLEHRASVKLRFTSVS